MSEGMHKVWGTCSASSLRIIFSICSSLDFSTREIDSTNLTASDCNGEDDDDDEGDDDAPTNEETSLI